MIRRRRPQNPEEAVLEPSLTEAKRRKAVGAVFLTVGIFATGFAVKNYFDRQSHISKAVAAMEAEAYDDVVDHISEAREDELEMGSAISAATALSITGSYLVSTANREIQVMRTLHAHGLLEPPNEPI